MPSAETLVSGTDFSLPSSGMKFFVEHPVDEMNRDNSLTITCPQTWLDSATLADQDRQLWVLALDVDIIFLHELSGIKNVNKSECLLHNQINRHRTWLPAILHRFGRDELATP